MVPTRKSNDGNQHAGGDHRHADRRSSRALSPASRASLAKEELDCGEMIDGRLWARYPIGL